MSRGYLEDYAAVGVSDSCGVRMDLLGAQAGRGIEGGSGRLRETAPGEAEWNAESIKMGEWSYVMDTSFNSKEYEN